MQEFDTLDRYAKTPLGRRITISVCVIVIALVTEIARLNAKITEKEKDFKADKLELMKEKQKVELQLNDCKDQAKIEADRATKAALQDLKEYKELYLTTVELKERVRKKGLIQ